MRTNVKRLLLRICVGVALMAAAMGVTTGCASHPVASVNVGVQVPNDPPAPMDETVPPSPGIGYFWIGGSWLWSDHWVWEPGRWELPPHQGAVWIPHRYVYRNGRHIFVRGGWQ